MTSIAVASFFKRAGEVASRLSERSKRLGAAHMAVIAGAFLASLFAWNHFMSGQPPTVDTENVFAQAEMLKSGMMPYRDFVFEFPPLAMLVFLAPALFAPDFQSYVFLYGLEMIAFAAIAAYFMMKIAEGLGFDKRAAGIMFVFLVVAGNLVVGKFDIAAAAAATASLYLCLRGRYCLGIAVMSAAALMKIYPAALIPLIFIAMAFDPRVERKLKAALFGAASFAAVALAVFAPLLLASVSVGDATSFLGFHSDRGFQVESTVAVAIQALGQLGLADFYIVPSHSTYDVAGPMADALLPFGMPACVAMVASTLAFAAFNERRPRPAAAGGLPMRLALYSVMAMIAFMLSNKVFSTQYVVWLYPMLPLMALAARGRRRAAIIAASAAAAFLSMQIVRIGHLGDAFPAVNIARDAMLAFLFAQALLMAMERAAPEEGADPPREG
ncbi:MAG: glycosyltransferase 87 family protein [Candidatus Methanoplasma sp.]|jgi:hypothetical protein|nr:glycosyltransferase 87 family protein [Candidatus Methanoplasma sp.]